MLTASLALAVGIAIYDLTIRELELSSTATQSQYAVYAADAGAECALYWDFKCTNAGYCTSSGGSAFPTSTDSGQAPADPDLLCNSQAINDLWDTSQKSASSATTTFTLNVSGATQGSATTTCAVVSVGKYTAANGALYTSVISRGYNTCTVGVVRVERALQVSY